MSFDRVIFGDNQFLGVSHFDQARGSTLFRRYNKSEYIIEVLGFAYDAGIRSFMFTPHERYRDLFDEVLRSKLFPDMKYIPCLPYAHKYWNQLSKGGILGLAEYAMKGIAVSKLPATLFDLIRGEKARLIELLVDVETHMCQGLPVQGVFLQNLAFDFLLATEQHSLIESFNVAVESRLQTTAGYITMNHARATEMLCDELGFESPWICSNCNVDGFRMNPSPEDVLMSMSSGKTKNIAMSIFSGPNMDPVRAQKFARELLEVGTLQSVLFGSSSERNISRNLREFL
jgi:hypothetical protein